MLRSLNLVALFVGLALMSSADVIQYAIDEGWRASPLAAATRLSARDIEKGRTEERFVSAPHLKITSDAIVDAVYGEGPKYIIINMPPGHGKSWLITRRSSEWFLGNFPSKRVIMCGYGAEFAETFGRMVRDDVTQHEDLLGFGVAPDSKAKNRWHTTRGGEFVTAGIGGQVSGRRAELLIVDDPIKNWEEAYSPIYRDRIWNWFASVARTRILKDSVIVLVMTRWHSDDIAGRLLSGKYGDPKLWKSISFPAIWDQDEPQVIELSNGKTWSRAKGESLWPERFPAQFLLDNYRTSEEIWRALYQQEPLNTTGIGAVYHNFDPAVNIVEQEFDPRFSISLTMDFNVDPMSWLICQVEETFGARAYLTNQVIKRVRVLEEISLKNSNTPEAVEEFAARMRKYIRHGKKPSIEIFGDAAGQARSHAGPDLEDHTIVKTGLRRHGFDFTWNIPSKNGSVRSRVTLVNSALKSGLGVPSMFIDPSCEQLITDLKELRWKRDSNGNATNLVDDSDKMRGHLADALGYLAVAKFSLDGGFGDQSGLLQ